MQKRAGKAIFEIRAAERERNLVSHRIKKCTKRRS
jgi:hypothetical protein